MSENTSPLPPVHRLVTWTNPSGRVECLEDTVAIKPSVHDLHVGKLFVQPDPLGDPTKGAEYTNGIPKGFIPESGAYVFALDFAPNKSGHEHFTQSVDYIVVTKGTIQVKTPGGQSHSIEQGGFYAVCGNVHTFVNDTEEWARMIVIINPGAAYHSSEGKTLEELYPGGLAA